MTDIKCPWCDKPLQEVHNKQYPNIMWCPNYDCPGTRTDKICGNAEMWQELTKTMEQLRIAWDALDAVECGPDAYDIYSVVQEAKTKIKALDKTYLENLELLVNNVFK